jgi:predicted RND superfamily exporter protein
MSARSPHRLLDRLLEGTARVSHRHHRAVLGLFLVLAVGCGLVATRLTLDANVLALLPREDPAIAAFADTLDRFGSTEELMVVLRLPEEAVLPPYLTFAGELASRLRKLGSIHAVEARVGSPEEVVERMLPHAVLFLDGPELKRLEARLSHQGIRERARELRRLLATPQGTLIKPLLLLDPFGLSDVLLGRLRPEGRAGLRADFESGYYLSSDRRLLLLFAQPVRPPHDLAFTGAMLAEVKAVIGETLADWPEITGVGDLSEGTGDGGETFDPGKSVPPPEVALGGSYPAALEDADFIFDDLELGVPVALAAVLLLFVVAFRRLSPLVFAAAPLACGLLLTFAFATVALGSLSSATSGTAALLIGLGVDFVIVAYGRYVEERRRGADLDTALAIMAVRSGRAVVVGAATTAATFGVFLVTRFRGLWEMGLLTGVGILLTMATVLVLLPALLTWNARRHAAHEDGDPPSFFLHGFGVERLMALALRHPRSVLALAVAITVATAPLLPRLHFEGGMKALRPEGNRGTEVAAEVGREFGSGVGSMMLVIRGETAEEVLARTAQATEGARALIESGVLSGVASATSLLPPPERQEQALAWIANHRDDLVAPSRLEEELSAALAGEGLRLRPFARGLELWIEAVSPTRMLEPRDLEKDPTAHRLLERFLRPPENGWMSVVHLQPEGDRWRNEPPPEVEALAAELGPGVVLTGGNVLARQMRLQVTGDAWLAGILGLGAVALLLWLDYRSLADTVLTLVPLGMGVVWMLGAMVLLEIDLNFLNTFVTTMILGIGVDYGLHVVHRRREAGASPDDLAAQLPETGKAVLLAALSTVCGFGTLALSHYPGLRTTGQVAILGALLTALVAVTVLPAWFAVRNRLGSRRAR